MADESQNVKIEFPLEVEDGFPPIRVELLHARPVNADQFQVLNSPFFVENVAYGDLVTVTVEADGRRTFKACACRPGRHDFKCGVRGLGREELGEFEHIDPGESGSSEGRYCLINMVHKLGMGLSPVWRSHIVQIP